MGLRQRGRWLNNQIWNDSYPRLTTNRTWHLAARQAVAVLSIPHLNTSIVEIRTTSSTAISQGATRSHLVITDGTAFVQLKWFARNFHLSF